MIPFYIFLTFVSKKKSRLLCRELVEVAETTFLHLLAGVLCADAGEISVDGHLLHLLSESKRDQLRAGKLGMSFNPLTCLVVLVAWKTLPWYECKWSA